VVFTGANRERGTRTARAAAVFCGRGGGPWPPGGVGQGLAGSYAVVVAGWGVFSHRKGARMSW